jgi:predicted nucleic acid-binding protein
MARRQRVRVVLDTMVVIQGARAFRQQPPASTTAELRLLVGWINDATAFDWLYSKPILAEYRTVLRRLNVPPHAAGRFVNLLWQAGIVIAAQDLGRFSPDPQDDPFYHCALTGQAAYIITDNVADFPPLPGRKRPQILTPAEAVMRLYLDRRRGGGEGAGRT